MHCAHDVSEVQFGATLLASPQTGKFVAMHYQIRGMVLTQHWRIEEGLRHENSTFVDATIYILRVTLHLIDMRQKTEPTLITEFTAQIRTLIREIEESRCFAAGRGHNIDKKCYKPTNHRGEHKYYVY